MVKFKFLPVMQLQVEALVNLCEASKEKNKKQISAYTVENYANDLLWFKVDNKRIIAIVKVQLY